MLVATAARRPGVSSMPLRPMSKSPRAADWSSEANATWTNCGVPPQLARDQLGDLDVEADELLRIRRIGLDKWRAAFRVAAPAQRRRLC